MATLQQVRQAQPKWFSRENKRFFGDVSYKVLHGKRTGNPFLVRSTYQWSDMFGEPKTLRYRVNPLREDLTIAPILDDHFIDLRHVKDWLQSQ